MARLTGEQVMNQAFGALYGMDALVDNYSLTYSNLDHNPDMEEAKMYLLASLERYIARMRLTLVARNIEKLEGINWDIPAEAMFRLNGIVGFYSVPRTFLWLYIHAHLYALISDNTDYLDRFDALVVELQPEQIPA